MKKFLIASSLAFIFGIGALAISPASKAVKADDTYTVTFDMQGVGDNIVVENIEDGLELSEILFYSDEFSDFNPNPEGKHLLGFTPNDPSTYKNVYDLWMDCSETFWWYVQSDLTLYAGWVDAPNDDYSLYKIEDQSLPASQVGYSLLGNLCLYDLPIASLVYPNDHYWYVVNVSTNGLVNTEDENDVVDFDLTSGLRDYTVISLNSKSFDLVEDVNWGDENLLRDNSSLTDYIYYDSVTENHDFEFLASKVDLEGKILVINRTFAKTVYFSDVITSAVDNGAAALIFANDDEDREGGDPIRILNEQSDIPVASSSFDSVAEFKKGTKHDLEGKTDHYYTGSLLVQAEPKYVPEEFDGDLPLQRIEEPMEEEELHVSYPAIVYGSFDNSKIKANSKYVAEITYKVTIKENIDDEEATVPEVTLVDKTYLTVSTQYDTEYNFVFEPNGGTGSIETGKAIDEQKYTLPTSEGLTAPEGKEFDCWMVNNERKNPGQKLTAKCDMQVKALWKDITYYSATYKGAGDNVDYVVDKLVKGSEYTLVDFETTGFVAPEGKQFKGWIIGSEFYNPGDKVTMNGNLTIQAIYEDIPVDPEPSTSTTTSPVDPSTSSSSISPEPTPTPEEGGGGLSGGAIAGIVIGSVLVLGLGGFVVYWFVIAGKSFKDLGAVFAKAFEWVKNFFKKK